MAATRETGSDEAVLTRRAAAGEAAAIAELYTRYEKRAYNLALRVTGSEDDAADAVQDAFLSVLRQLPKLDGRELHFGSYLFTSTRNACYDLMQKRKRAEPSDAIPESAAPVSAGGAFDPGDPEDDPDRKVMLEAQQEEIREANLKLPERQREVLALRELEGMSYDEIAEIMGMNRNSVAQLISRARISLRDALRGTALASVAVSSADCERALPLIAASQDGQLRDAADTAWLDQHLAGCDTCRVGREAMEEAGASYRCWVPVAAAPFLFRETMAHAAEMTGADLDELLGKRRRRGPRVRDAVLAGAASLVLLLGVFAASAGDNGATVESAPAASAAPEEKAVKKKAKKRERRVRAAAGGGAAPAPDRPAPEEPADSEPAVSGGGAGSAPSSPVTRRRSGSNFGGSGGGSPQQGVEGGDPPPVPQPTPPPAPAPTSPPAVTTPPAQTTPTRPTRPTTCRDPASGRPIPCP